MMPRIHFALVKKLAAIYDRVLISALSHTRTFMIGAMIALAAAAGASRQMQAVWGRILSGETSGEEFLTMLRDTQELLDAAIAQWTSQRGQAEVLAAMEQAAAQRREPATVTAVVAATAAARKIPAVSFDRDLDGFRDVTRLEPKG